MSAPPASPSPSLPPPASFGHAALAHFHLDPGTVYLNHGTVGVTPRAVLEQQQALQREIERHPARFMLRELATVEAATADHAPPTRLRQAAAAVAGQLGLPSGEDLVFVDNASAGVNAVLRSLALAPGDEILLIDHAYGAVARTAAFVAQQAGATVRTLALPFPLSDAGSCLDVLAAGLTPRTRLAVLDHISSETALVFPLAEMAALCRARSVPVLADGAHAPGALALDIPALGVDWYVANLHKWAFAPRGCAILWAAPGRRAALHPAIISWGLGQGWTHEFDWTGTRDPTPWLCAPAGFRFMQQTLGEVAMRRWNHELALEAAQELGARWQGDTGLPWRTPEALVGCMVTLPLPARHGCGGPAARRLHHQLQDAHGIEVAVIPRGSERLWLRVSAQVYNEAADIETLATAIEACG